MVTRINRRESYPRLGQDFALVSFILSLAAIVFAGIALKSPQTEIAIENTYSKIMSLAGIIVSVFGVLATVYFVIMGINILLIEKKLQETLDKANQTLEKSNESMEKSSETLSESKKIMRFQHDATIASLDAVEGVDGVDVVYIRLAKARLAIKSLCTTETEKEEGVREIQGLSRYQEDIEILQENIIDNQESSENLKEMAKEAIKAIEDKQNSRNNHQEVSTEPSLPKKKLNSASAVFIN